MKRIESIMPSGYAGFTTRIITASAPVIRPTIYLPLLVCAEVTGSVAMKTAPKAKPPTIRCHQAGYSVTPSAWNK